MRHVFWFSCGATSAVATKIALPAIGGGDSVIARIVIDNEHADNDRFTRDCEQWYGRGVDRLRSAEYRDVDHVIEKRRFLSGPFGAACSLELKKRVREDFQQPCDIQYFGFTVEERKRADRFREHNPEIDCRFPLIDAGLNKDDCFALLARANIALPEMYNLGFRNNNCIGCVKANGLRYWKRVKDNFPDVYDRRAAQERMIGATVNYKDGNHIYLDELHARLDNLPDTTPEPNISCGILCEISYMDMAEIGKN